MRKHVMALSIQAALLGTLSMAAQTGFAQEDTTAATVQELEAVQVTGSRIARTQVEGPAPITVITAEEIKSSGLTTVDAMLRSLNQNSGELQSQQSTLGSQTTPGAQTVDLRGLGPNKTLVLINGRRVADFPLPLRGRSNFTDIGNIPLGMIDRVEVLTGSASAVYGSDAMAGVINFIFKKSADGTTIDYTHGDYERGGGRSETLSLTSGYSTDRFNAIFGLELKKKDPLWGYQRKIQDSREDNPDATEREPRETFLRYDDYGLVNIDPGALCDNVSQLNEGTTGRYEDEYGFYCGSQKWIGYGTVESERKSANAYASFDYAINDKLSWFADVQLGYGKIGTLGATIDWRFQDLDAYRGDRGYFHNANSSSYTGVEYWTRRFAPEEAGSLDNMMTRTTQKTFGIVTGFKGTLGESWDYEAAYNHSQYDAEVRFPRVIAAAANDLLLGPSEGYDDYGYNIRSPDPANFYRALTRQEYESITAKSIFKPKARSDSGSFTFSNSSLFGLPGGDAGFAGVAEYGTQSYEINPDPDALTSYYYGARYGDGNGDRSHWGVGGELRMPVLDSVTLSAAGRWDEYRYGGISPGKFTYNLGLEWRPVDSLLVRGSYGTGFRAPDLHYLFAERDYYRTTHRDYYGCREAVGDALADTSACPRSLRNAGGRDEREGNPELDYETSKSFTAGLVWSPSSNFDVSLDYFDIKVYDQVEDMDTDKILIDEANCRLGYDVQGNPVDPTSPTCLDAVPRALRDGDGTLLGVFFQPINISQQKVAGLDLAAHYRLETGIGDFHFGVNYTHFYDHDSQQFVGDETIDHFAVNSGFDLPRDKGSAKVSWEKGKFGASLFGQYLGKLPSYESYAESWDPDDPTANYGTSPWMGSTWRYNAGFSYRFSDNLRFSLAIDNLFDKMPPKDPSYTGYPYYDISWFDSVGRAYYFNITYKFGGSSP
ncbi:MAG: TonB-dependent receptor [Pseudoxanthomonas sp.]